jgi:hypothetical protein
MKKTKSFQSIVEEGTNRTSPHAKGSRDRLRATVTSLGRLLESAIPWLKICSNSPGSGKSPVLISLSCLPGIYGWIWVGYGRSVWVRHRYYHYELPPFDKVISIDRKHPTCSVFVEVQPPVGKAKKFHGPCHKNIHAHYIALKTTVNAT